MWNIMPETAERIKDELKGRQAALRARYESEIQKLDADLSEIEAFERFADSFAQKHLQQPAAHSSEPEPIALLEAAPTPIEAAAETDQEPSEDPGLIDTDTAAAEAEIDLLPIAAPPNVTSSPSRWRLRKLSNA